MGKLKLLVLVGAVALLAVGTQATLAAGTHGGTASVQNAGFEADGTGVATPSGWRDFGVDGASYTEAGGYDGSYRLSHWSDKPYGVTTMQTVAVGWGGSYTLGVWARSSATGRNLSMISLSCGGMPQRTVVPVSNDWLHLVVSAPVRGRSCTIALSSVAAAGEWSNFDAVTLEPGDADLSVLGADISSLKKSEDLGGVYRDSFGRPGDALRILHDHGLNWIRLRVFVNPADGYSGKAQLLTMARRARALGVKVLVDLHYSDFWADPGKQWTPPAWQGKSFPDLKQTFVAYTRDIVRSLVRQGTPPAMVQIGNEINSGILWDYGATWTGDSWADNGFGTYVNFPHTENWPQLAQLVKAGYDAVKSASPSTKVMLHLANGGDNGLYQWWFGTLSSTLETLGLGDSTHLPFDVIGVSYYPYWHGTFAAFQSNINDIAARYDKDVIVAETAYPFTTDDKDGTPNSVPSLPWTPLIAGYDASPAGQTAMFRDVLSLVRAVPDGHGLGAFYWDATWTAVPGNGWAPNNPSSGNAWENQALFDYNGMPLPAMNDFRP